jgi:predicted dehydrogenase
MHLEVVLAFAGQGYHILCEKPMATSVDDCIRLEAAVKKAGIIFGVGHGMVPCASGSPTCGSVLLVMRYSPYSQEISKIVSSRSLGELVNIVQVEPVGYYHFAHSFVRGNWGNEKQSSFSLLTKCCQYV